MYVFCFKKKNLNHMFHLSDISIKTTHFLVHGKYAKKQIRRQSYVTYTMLAETNN